MSRNEVELLLNEKENNLIKCKDYLKQEKILNSKLIKKIDDLHIQYEADKTNYQLQHSQFIDKVTHYNYCLYMLYYTERVYQFIATAPILVKCVLFFI